MNDCARQVILTSLSSQHVSLPPLDERELSRVCTEAFRLHNYQTQAVTSEINGGGKTHYIKTWVADQQAVSAAEIAFVWFVVSAV